MNDYNASLRRAITIEDLRLLARKRLPRIVFDYLDGGSESEVTLRANQAAFDQVKFRPRYGISVNHCDLRVRVLDTSVSLPLLLAPIGYSGLLSPGGELAAAKAAAAAGTIYVLSTFSGQRLEEVQKAGRHVWYQLYLLGSREAAESAIARAEAAGISALVLTVDTIVPGMRLRDIRNGASELLAGRFFSKLPFLEQLLRRPRWLVRYFRNGGLPRLKNVVLPGRGALSVLEARQDVLTWEDFRWIRKLWRGPIVVKGILTGDDARRALDEGAHAIVVSNHGGRQLDGLPASLRVLPEVLRAVDGRAEVYMDSGIRRGSDAVKAICLGARAVLCGRAFAYGLAAAGEHGVARSLEILQDDLERTLKLLGCGSITMLDPSYVMQD
ncbi:MAG: alpha-hydroxy-acid oxidizing protein [Acidobacteriia bacterium]|nr:alpha-hydroxy-acid oxidizing protein [Terriglobia bacterium]